MRGTQGVGAFSITSPGVKMAISVAGLVKSTFESIASIPKFYEAASFRSDLFEHVKAPNKSDSRAHRIQNLTEACTHIRDNEKTIRKSLFVAKNAGVLSKANEALEGLSSRNAKTQNQALEKGEEYVTNLRARVNSKFGVALANVVTKVSGLASIYPPRCSYPNCTVTYSCQVLLALPPSLYGLPIKSYPLTPLRI